MKADGAYPGWRRRREPAPRRWAASAVYRRLSGEALTGELTRRYHPEHVLLFDGVAVTVQNVVKRVGSGCSGSFYFAAPTRLYSAR